MTRTFSRVGVVGLGTMGAGIVEVVARHGLTVVAVEVDEPALSRGRAHVAQSTERAVQRGKLTIEGHAALLGRVHFSVDLDELANVDLVIEAVPERLDLKRDIFSRLDKICRPDTVLATNTSSLSVTEIAVSTQRPGKVIGLHFFNPAPVMRLVEIVRSVVTEPEVVADVEAFAQSLGKVDVTIGDRAGFIANALLFGYLNNAASMYEAHVATREDLDASMRLGCGLPMGPLSLLDLIGLDTAYEILDTMYKQSRNRLHAPTPILKQMITAGLLGRKSGRGFYTYLEAGSPNVIDDSLTPSAVSAFDGAADQVRRIGVVGSGTMAAGIVEVCAKAGYGVVFVARSSAKVDAISVSALDNCDVLIEAVIEDIDVKRALFGELDRVCKPGAVLATTTSSLPVIDCAAATDRPQDVIGLHFFNPAAVMKLVEVVSTVSTDLHTEAISLDLVARLGRHAVRCGDRAGFLVNALLFPYLNDAVKMLEAHYASADDIDSAMQVGCGYPMGPFALLDVVGLDVSLAIERTLYQEFREPGFAPAPLLEHLVTAGRLGRKSGKGFREYA
jgi:3-hydroxybutyryl-CoA dehydrogenase